MARAARVSLAIATLVLVASCSSSPSREPWQDPAAEPNASVASDTAPATSTGLVLAEIGFDPPPGDPQFIEIANAAADPVDLADLRLEADGRPIEIAPEGSTVGSGERLLVVLDGPKDPESHVVHTAGDLGRADGNVRLLGPDQQLLDSVAWGPGQAGAVSMAVGDFVPPSIEAGTTIGRAPGADQALTPTEWVVYQPAAASPGEVNSVPTVPVLLPLDGAILEASDATLEWYPVRGAASYQVQVGTETTFADPLVDETVAEPTVDLGSLGPGAYVWRVQAIAADGSMSDESTVSGFTLGGSTRGTPASGVGSVDVTKRLGVPFRAQRKDTKMLLLEEPNETGHPHSWDAPHDRPSKDDPADQLNCAIAMIAMINNFYGGDLSQDRIGYEIFKDRQPGPEEDLNYGYGLTAYAPGAIPPGGEDQTLKAFAFALGAPVTFKFGHSSFDEVWASVTSSIDAGRPVAGAGEHHGYVVTGYTLRADGHRIMHVNDPARGSYSVDLSTGKGNAASVSLWLMPANVKARKQEPGVSTDTDGDRVVDFDETERFKTNPNKKDTDGDKVDDKPDVASGVFEPTYGYALKPGAGNRGRDFDGDNKPTELDPDSDHGGCLDGDEDTNGDGRRADKETWNFDAADDICGDLSGTITWTRHETYDDPDSTAHGTSDDVVTLNVRFDEEDGQWVDAGSSYSWTGSSKRDTNPGDDPEAGYCNEHHKTTTTTGGEAFATSLVSSIFIDVYRDTNEVYVTSWVAGELRGHDEDGTLTSDGGPTQWCELVPSDYTQGGGSTQDSQAEWGQVPRCLNYEESVVGTISKDGKTVAFSCTNTETTHPQEATVVETMTVSGQLTFAAG